MSERKTLGEELTQRGVSRRSLLTYCSYLAALMALPPGSAPVMAEALAGTRRRSVIWLSFQECTGCTESLTRSFKPTLEDLIFNLISLDYHHTLQAASGASAGEALLASMKENAGKYIVVVDGSVPTGNDGYSTIAGVSNLQMLKETVERAAFVIAVGTCAAFGGISRARPNPTGAAPVSEFVKGVPLINVSGCPPVPEAMTGTIVHLLSFGAPPALDRLKRPRAFFGETVHDRCYRLPFYNHELFARSFDDEGARKGWCLYKVGCRGPIASNACATLKWNGGVSFPIQSGHGCLGCSEPGFWDMGGFYKPLATPMRRADADSGATSATGATPEEPAGEIQSVRPIRRIDGEQA